jgi:UDP-2,3-diacylglucosamine pyrophosphatase LpxH
MHVVCCASSTGLHHFVINGRQTVLKLHFRTSDMTTKLPEHWDQGLLFRRDEVPLGVAPQNDLAPMAPGPQAHNPSGLRAIFISDLHIGTPGFQADALMDFLRQHPSDYLYLVGDIVDGWQLRRRWFWPQSHNDVVQKFLRRARKGCRVILVPGNHDEFARAFAGLHFGGVEVLKAATHRTADGRSLWVTHGDQFDGVVQCAKWLAYTGDYMYELTLRFNRHLNHVRGLLGLPYWSLSAYLKNKVKRAVSYVQDFEVAVAREAKRLGHDGVVCGHIHRPEMRTIDGVLYCNDGDWVESRSALVEHHDGRLELIQWWGSGTAAPPVATKLDPLENDARAVSAVSAPT